MSPANAQTVRDDFSAQAFNNNDGSVNWAGDWIEVDANATGPVNGNVLITAAGELSLEDQPNTGGEPGVAREANLAGAISANLIFDWRTTAGVDLNDAITLDVSDNGGATWTTLEVFTNLDGVNSGSRNIDIGAFIAANTQVRFRVTNLYGGGNEAFLIDFVEIAYTVPLVGTELSVTQSDTPDPVNITAPLVYAIEVTNSGPEDATGVVLTDTLPAGVSFQSATATLGSCALAGNIVSCGIGAIPSGETEIVNIVVTAPFTAGVITNDVSVSGNETDPLIANNSASESTTVQNLNVSQVCYLVADNGGGNGGNDLLTRIDTADFDPASNETNIGTGTGTNQIEAIAFNSATGVVFAANAGQLGTLNTTTGVFNALPQAFGTGSGSAGNITFTDVDGLSFDATTGVLFGSHRRGGNDLLIQIDMVSGTHVPNAFGAGIDYVEIQPVLGNTIVDDIAVDPTTGVLYAAVNSGGSTDRLITIDKATGATTDVALITVPDIEGLGTDPFGQLWGTSGTQDILYEINKTTGFGSNGRPIDNGGDYESVDCFAVSPTVSTDLAVTKTVDDAAPTVGDTVSYTITVDNIGLSTASVVQIVDQLPAGLSFVSATVSQGTYDDVSGDWFVGTIAAGNDATLTLQASVSAGTGGTTITNTAAVEFVSQQDTNSSNDTASVDIDPIGNPALTVAKTVVAQSDPINGAANPFSIPGAIMRYTIELTNSGDGSADSGTLVVTDAIPASMALRVLDFDGSTPGPVSFEDGSPASGLTYTFVSLADLGDDVAFSEDGGLDNFEYVPTADANGVDLNITHIQITPQATFLGNTGSGDPNFQLLLLMVVR